MPELWTITLTPRSLLAWQRPNLFEHRTLQRKITFSECYPQIFRDTLGMLEYFRMHFGTWYYTGICYYVGYAWICLFAGDTLLFWILWGALGYIGTLRMLEHVRIHQIALGYSGTLGTLENAGVVGYLAGIYWYVAKPALDLPICSL